MLVAVAAANQAPVQVNPQTGQPDYSAQWAEYYRSLGMHREADMIEQQAKQGKPEHNPQPGKILESHLVIAKCVSAFP